MQTQATQHTNIAEALKLEKSQLEKQMHTFQRKLEEVGVNAITLRPCALTAVDANNTIGLKEAYRARLDRLSASLPQRLQHVKERLSDVQGMGMQMDADDIAVISGRADTSADIDVDASNTTDMTESTIGDTRESNNTARTHMEETKEQIEEQPEEIEEQNEEVEEAEADREQHTLEHEKEEAQIEEEKDQDQDQEEEEEEVQGEEEEEEQEQEEEEEEEEHEEEQQEEQVEEEVEINAHVEERMEQESEEEELEPQQQHVDGAIAFHFQPSNDLALSLDEEEKRFMEELAAQAQ